MIQRIGRPGSSANYGKFPNFDSVYTIHGQSTGLTSVFVTNGGSFALDRTFIKVFNPVDVTLWVQWSVKQKHRVSGSGNSNRSVFILNEQFGGGDLVNEEDTAPANGASCADVGAAILQGTYKKKVETERLSYTAYRQVQNPSTFIEDCGSWTDVQFMVGVVGESFIQGTISGSTVKQLK